MQYTTLPIGSYRAEIQAVNTKYNDYKSGWNTQNYFTVAPFIVITVTANPAEGGRVNGGGTDWVRGSYTTLQAVPNEGWRFKGWLRNGQPVTDWVDEGTRVANYGLSITKDETFEALFERETPATPTYTIDVSATGSGTVSGGGSYEAGNSVTVTATPSAGYEFKGWMENGTQISTSASYTFEAAQDRQLMAVFEIIPPVMYTISVSASPTDGGTVTGGGSYEAGNSVTVMATPASGYKFVKWTEDGTEVIGAAATYTFTADKARQLTAVFEQEETPTPPTNYTVNVSANLTAGGTVTGGQSYTSGSSVTVTATANSGYHFVEWRENGAQVSTSASYQFTVTKDRACGNNRNTERDHA